MSNILKGILNETSPHNYDSDWDYQDSVAKSGRSRARYPQDDTFDADVAYSRKMYQLGQQQKAAKEKAQRDSDHDRLATGTNEGSDNPWGDQGNFVGDAPQPNIGGTTVKRLQVGDTVKYLGQLARIDAMSKTGNTSRITIERGMGGITQDVLTRDLKRINSGMAEAGTGLDIDRSIPGRTIARISGDIKHRTGSPSGKKLPDYHPDDDYDQWSGKVGPSIHDDEEDTFDTDYTGDEEGELKEISNEKLGQYKTAAALDAGKADKEGDYKRGDKRFSGIVKATKKQFANDTKKSNVAQGMDEADEKPADPFKTGYPRVNNPKILGTQNRAKSAYHPPARPPIKKLDKPLPENLGNELKSKSLEALQQVKQQLEKQRMADLEQWENDFKQNTVAKFTARQPSFMRQEPTQVAQPKEKHSVLKARLVQLDNAIQKQAVLDKMLQRLDSKGLLTPAMQADTDTSMLVRDGAKDNYVSLNQKLDKALELIKTRLMTNKAAFSKSKAIDEEKQRLDAKCWKGYKKQGTKMKGDTRVNNCVPVKESSIMQGLNQIDEGWKEKLGAAALTGAMALGAAGANARVTPGDDPNINRLTGKPNITQPVQAQTPTKAEAPKGFSKEYLQSVANGTHPRPMISVEKAQELLKNMP